MAEKTAPADISQDAVIKALWAEIERLKAGIAQDDRPVTKVAPFDGVTKRKIARMNTVKGAKTIVYDEVDTSGGFMVHTYNGSVRVQDEKALESLNLERVEYV